MGIIPGGRRLGAARSADGRASRLVRTVLRVRMVFQFELRLRVESCLGRTSDEVPGNLCIAAKSGPASEKKVAHDSATHKERKSGVSEK